MTSNASQVLGVIGRDLAGLGHRAEALTGQLNTAKVAALGFLGVFAGGAMLAATAKLVGHGADLVHQQALMKTAGMDNLEIAQATAKAWQTTRDVMGSTVTENARSIRELRMVFGSTQEAIDNLNAVTKAQAVMNSLIGGQAGDQVFDLAKALEIKGVSMDPAHFTALLNDMVSASIASGGRVTGSDFLSAFKFGRTATQGWSDEFVKTILPTLIQEMKGGGGFSGATGPGNALQSAFQAVVGGTMSNKAAEEFFRLGLVQGSGVIRTRTGSVKGIRPGGVEGSAEFQTNPFQWVQDVLVPALNAKGITGTDAVREEVAHLFANRTAQQIITMFATQQQRFQKDATLINQAPGGNAYDTLINQDPTAKIKAFTDAWQNLLTALGAPLVQPATDFLMTMARGMNILTAAIAAHPDVARVIGEVGTAVGAVAVAAGAFAIGSAAAVALGILTAPTGLFALAAGIEALGHALPSLPQWLIHMAAGAAVGAAVGTVVPGLGTVTGALGGALVGGLPGLNFPDLGLPDLNKHIAGAGHGGAFYPAVPPPQPAQSIQLHGDVNLDGKKVGSIVANGMADHASAPPTGPTGYDVRLGPLSPAALPASLP